MLGSILARGVKGVGQMIFNVLMTLELDNHLHGSTAAIGLSLLSSPSGVAEPRQIRLSTAGSIPGQGVIQTESRIFDRTR